MDPLSLAQGAGSLASLFGQIGGGLVANDYANKSSNIAREGVTAANDIRQQGLDKLIAMFGGADNLQKEYEKYKTDYANFDPTTQMGQFDSSKYTVDQYLDPSMKYQLDQSNSALQSSAQGAGGLYSGKAMKALGQNAEKFAAQDYGNAFNRMTTDRAFGYTDWTNHFNNEVANKTAQLNQLKSLLANSKGDLSSVAELLGNKVEGNANTVSDIAKIRSNLFAGKGKMFGDMISQATSPQNMTALAGGLGTLFAKTPDVSSVLPETGTWGVSPFSDVGSMTDQEVQDYAGAQAYNMGTSIDAGAWDALKGNSGVPTAASPFATGNNIYNAANRGSNPYGGL